MDAAESVKVEGLELKLLLEAIYEKYGYDMRDYSPASLRRRAQAALARHGLAHLGELQHRVLHDPAFFAQVFDDLTVRVSEMFRDPRFYAAFREKVVPVLRTYPQVKIWHSGCAGGEEAYASAILLSEEGLYERTQLYATDLSATAIEQAKQGIFSLEDVPSFRENYEQAGGTNDLSRYYTAAYGGIAMSEALRTRMCFFQHDLVSDHVFGEMHVVFCRNVLIYFNRALRERVLKKLTQSLLPGGFLCLGSSERLGIPAVERSFTEFCPGQRIYRYEG